MDKHHYGQLIKLSNQSLAKRSLQTVKDSSNTWVLPQRLVYVFSHLILIKSVTNIHWQYFLLAGEISSLTERCHKMTKRMPQYWKRWFSQSWQMFTWKLLSQSWQGWDPDCQESPYNSLWLMISLICTMLRLIDKHLDGQANMKRNKEMAFSPNKRRGP